MTTVTGLTADRMLTIEGSSVVDGDVVGNNLVLTKFNGSTIDAGNVRGPQGPKGDTGAKGDPGTGTDFAAISLARAYHDSAFTLVSGSNVKLPMNVVSYDLAQCWDAANGRYIAPSAGYYEVTAMVRVTGTASGQRLLVQLAKNGNVVTYLGEDSSSSASLFSASGSDVVYCNQHDYLELYAFCSAALKTQASSGSVNYMTVVRIT